MSVINQMLRDLDARQKAGQAPTDPALGKLTRDTVSVMSPAMTVRRLAPARRMAVILGLVLVLALAGVWLLTPGRDTQLPAAPPAPTAVAVEHSLAQQQM